MKFYCHGIYQSVTKQHKLTLKVSLLRSYGSRLPIGQLCPWFPTLNSQMGCTACQMKYSWGTQLFPNREKLLWKKFVQKNSFIKEHIIFHFCSYYISTSFFIARARQQLNYNFKNGYCLYNNIEFSIKTRSIFNLVNGIWFYMTMLFLTSSAFD